MAWQGNGWKCLSAVAGMGMNGGRRDFVKGGIVWGWAMGDCMDDHPRRLRPIADGNNVRELRWNNARRIGYGRGAMGVLARPFRRDSGAFGAIAGGRGYRGPLAVKQMPTIAHLAGVCGH